MCRVYAREVIQGGPGLVRISWDMARSASPGTVHTAFVPFWRGPWCTCGKGIEYKYRRLE
jgi:hypothetical protein